VPWLLALPTTEEKCDERRLACANCDSLEKRSGDVLEPSVVATMETIERKPDEEVESEVEKTGQQINDDVGRPPAGKRHKIRF
jgi:hypothetical protein